MNTDRLRSFARCRSDCLDGLDNVLTAYNRPKHNMLAIKLFVLSRADEELNTTREVGDIVSPTRK
jgi:hypothetical protein